ncbi:hypothetical protein ACWEP4_22835 [Streptomyces sp. NPDC004227]
MRDARRRREVEEAVGAIALGEALEDVEQELQHTDDSQLIG